MTYFPAPAPDYVGPAKFHGDATNKPIRRIVIHGTVTPCQRGQARNVAHYFRHLVTRPSSAHYIVDPGEVVQVVYDSVVAYHAPPNQGSLAVELCDPVADREGNPLPRSRWDSEDHTEMLHRAAELVAGLGLAYDVPLRHIGPWRLRLGWRGVTGHAAVTKAWHQTDHWDPGEFPWRRFMGFVAAEADEKRARRRRRTT